MSLTNFPYGITSMGIPVVGSGTIPASFGDYYFVDSDNGSDANNGKSLKKAFATVQKALDTVVTNHNDVICLSGYSYHTLAAMLTVSKSRVHFVGLDGASRKYGQGARIQLPVTTAATDIAVMKNTGVRNSFTNIKFDNENTLAQSLSVVAEGGEYAEYRNCEMYRGTLLNGATSCELLLNGDSAQFYNCTIGSLADLVVGDVIHPCVRLAANQVGAGLVTRDVSFYGTHFWRRAGGTTTAFVYWAAATDVQRLLYFEDCMFINAINASATPAAAVTGAAALTVGACILKDCGSQGNTVMAAAGKTIYVLGSVPTFATTGVAVTT